MNWEPSLGPILPLSKPLKSLPGTSTLFETLTLSSKEFIVCKKNLADRIKLSFTEW